MIGIGIVSGVEAGNDLDSRMVYDPLKVADGRSVLSPVDASCICSNLQRGRKCIHNQKMLSTF